MSVEYEQARWMAFKRSIVDMRLFYFYVNGIDHRWRPMALME